MHAVISHSCDHLSPGTSWVVGVQIRSIIVTLLLVGSHTFVSDNW